MLSRFDLLFVVLDQLDPDSNRRIAAHVIRGNCYKSAHGHPGHDSDYDDDDNDVESDIDGGPSNTNPSGSGRDMNLSLPIKTQPQNRLHSNLMMSSNMNFFANTSTLQRRESNQFSRKKHVNVLLVVMLR